MSTISDIIGLARVDLNDPDGTTWPDSELLAHALAAINQAYKAAPSLFFGLYSTMPLTTLALTDSSPLPPVYDRAIADYICARAHMKDDEDAKDSEAGAFITLFKGELGAV